MSDYQVLNQLKPPWDYAVTADGRIFFINESTRQTSWLCPLTNQPLQTGLFTRPGLPQGWQVGFTADKRPYFVNHIERTTSFEEPRSGRASRKKEGPGEDAQSRARSRSPSGLLRSSSKRSRQPSMRIVRDPASRIELSGWLEHKQVDGVAFGSKWKGRFCVLADFTLFLYKEPSDVEAVESVALAGYQVMRDQPVPGAKRFPIRLSHEGVPPLELAAATAEEQQRWLSALQFAVRMELPHRPADPVPVRPPVQPPPARPAFQPPPTAPQNRPPYRPPTQPQPQFQPQRPPQPQFQPQPQRPPGVNPPTRFGPPLAPAPRASGPPIASNDRPATVLVQPAAPFTSARTSVNAFERNLQPDDAAFQLALTKTPTTRNDYLTNAAALQQRRTQSPLFFVYPTDAREHAGPAQPVPPSAAAALYVDPHISARVNSNVNVNAPPRSASTPRLDMLDPPVISLAPMADTLSHRSQPALYMDAGLQLAPSRAESPTPSTATFSRMPGTLRRAIGRHPLTETDLAGKSREEVTLLLIQYRRDQAKLNAALREYDERVRRLREVEETQRVRGLPAVAAAHERARADSELRAITTQLAVNEPVVRLLDNLIRLSVKADTDSDVQSGYNNREKDDLERDWRRKSASNTMQLVDIDPIERETLPGAVRDMSAVLQQLQESGAQLESFMRSLRSSYATLASPTGTGSTALRDIATYFETDLDTGRTVDLAAPRAADSELTSSSKSRRDTLERGRIRSSIKRRHHVPRDALRESEARSLTNSAFSTPRHSLLHLDTDGDQGSFRWNTTQPSTFESREASALNSPTSTNADYSTIFYGLPAQQRSTQLTEGALAKLTVRDIKKRLEERKRDYAPTESNWKRQRSLPRNWRSSSTSSLPVDLTQPRQSNLALQNDYEDLPTLQPTVKDRSPISRQGAYSHQAAPPSGLIVPADSDTSARDWTEREQLITSQANNELKAGFNANSWTNSPLNGAGDRRSVAQSLHVEPIKVDAVLLTLTDHPKSMPTPNGNAYTTHKNNSRPSSSPRHTFVEADVPQRNFDAELTSDLIDKSISVPEQLRIAQRYSPSDSGDESFDHDPLGKYHSQQRRVSRPPDASANMRRTQEIELDDASRNGDDEDENERSLRLNRADRIRRILAAQSLQHFTADEIGDRSSNDAPIDAQDVERERESRQQVLSIRHQLANEASKRTRELAAARKKRRETWSGAQTDRLMRLRNSVDELLDSADALTDTVQRSRQTFDYQTEASVW